jgi:hypothetical protein
VECDRPGTKWQIIAAYWGFYTRKVINVIHESEKG